MREKYHLTDAMTALPVVDIIAVPESGGRKASNRIAVDLCDEFKVKSQNDAKPLEAAKEIAYNEGFYKGVMMVGKYAGRKVSTGEGGGGWMYWL
jgi:leucyl-tRNA synthetase